LDCHRHGDVAGLLSNGGAIGDSSGVAERVFSGLTGLVTCLVEKTHLDLNMNEDRPVIFNFIHIHVQIPDRNNMSHPKVDTILSGS